MSELFAKKCWSGEFYLPNSYDKRFCGEIEYSPEKGVVLSYTIAGRDVPAQSDVLFGVLDTGEKCTLVGQFSPRDYQPSVRNGDFYRRDKAGFLYLAIGDFLAPDEILFDYDFSIPNLQEFFFPEGSVESFTQSDKPFYRLVTQFGEIEVVCNASFQLLDEEIESHFFSENVDALNDLKLAFKNIAAKHGEHFLVRKDIAYRIQLKFTSGAMIQRAYSQLEDLTNLFALLICAPVHPESINAYKEKAPLHGPITIKIYPSMVLNSRTTELCTRRRFHHSMPITKSTAPLDSIVGAWLRNPKLHSSVVSSIQNETGRRNEHAAHGDVVLYATQLESISHMAGKSEKLKYEYPIVTYGCQKLQATFDRIFANCGTTNVGEAISELRNELAHVGRPKKILEILTLKDLVQISQCLRLTIIGYIFTTIGVPQDAITRYQEVFSPDT